MNTAWYVFTMQPPKSVMRIRIRILTKNSDPDLYFKKGLIRTNIQNQNPS